MKNYLKWKFYFLKRTCRLSLFLITAFIVITILFIFPKRLQNVNGIKTIRNKQESNSTTTTNNKFENIYILHWKTQFLGQYEGSNLFVKEECGYTNCFTYKDSKIFDGDCTKFDVIVFYGRDVLLSGNNQLPRLRLPHQQYVFASAEHYPVCSNKFDGYFNWTWTFRLESDLSWSYLVIRDDHNFIIGPKPEIHWLKVSDMYPISQKLRYRLESKFKMAAWIVWNCESKNNQESFVNNINKELEKINKSYQVDIYGTCGTEQCPTDRACEDMIGEDYFFYFAFEESDSPDYVTEKLLRALEYNLVPVVYGGANYTRYMPDGIYLNAKALGEKKLAATMVEIMNDIERYGNMFRWKNHYFYHSPNFRPDSNNYCKFCTFLNKKRKSNSNKSVIKEFRTWWDVANRC